MWNDHSDLFLESLPFWSNLSNNEKSLVSQTVRRTKFVKGSTIHNASEECIGVIFIRSGQLRVSILSDDGREITLYRLFEGDVCILSASCVLESITFDVNINAEEDTDVYVIPPPAFQQLQDENVHVRCFAYQLLTARFSDVMWAMQQILFMSADRRLALFITSELKKQGGTTLKMTHEQVAKYMGSAREVVSRLLKYFEQDGLVRLSRGGIEVLDMDALIRLADR